MKHNKSHIIEMGWSYANQWIRGIHMFEYRLTHDLPEDKIFAHKIFRDDIDFHCYLTSLRLLEKAIVMANNIIKDGTVDKSLLKFRKLTPYLNPLRNLNEHFDDYLLQKGLNKSINSSGIRVYSVEYDKKSYKLNWLGFQINLRKSTNEAEKLYQVFIKCVKRLPKSFWKYINDSL